MLDIKEARKELIRTGCSNAQGDALRFMYANMLAFELCLSTTLNSIRWPIPEFYTVLGTVSDDEIYNKFKQMRED